MDTNNNKTNETEMRTCGQSVRLFIKKKNFPVHTDDQDNGLASLIRKAVGIQGRCNAGSKSINSYRIKKKERIYVSQ